MERDDALADEFEFELPQKPLEGFSLSPHAFDTPSSSGGTVPPSRHARRRFFRSSLLRTALEWDGDVRTDEEFPLELLLLLIKPC